MRTHQKSEKMMEQKPQKLMKYHLMSFSFPNFTK